MSVGLETAAPEIAAAFGDVPRQYATQVGKLGPHEAGAATPDAGRNGSKSDASAHNTGCCRMLFLRDQMVPDMTVTVSQPKGHRLTRPTNWLIGPSAARRIPAAERRDRAFVIARDVMTGEDHEMRNNSASRVAPGRGTWR